MINEVTVKPLVASIRQSILAATIVVPSLVMAAPQNGTVTDGNATITQSGTTTTITQDSPRAVIDWKSFNVERNESVIFDQKFGTSAATLNRINDQNPSHIHGKVTANGKVYLVNPNGIIFGKDATVIVGGFVASGMNVSDEHAESFQNGGKLIFSGNSNSKIENNGLIKASSSSVALIGEKIVNNGGIEAEGSVLLSGVKVTNNNKITAKLNASLIGSDKASLDFDGDGLMVIEVDRDIIINDTDSRKVINNGNINARYIKLSAEATNNAINSLVNNDGILKAEATTIENGKITLSANKVINKGELKVLARIGTDTGGTIEIAADKVELSGKVNTFWNKPKANINIDAKDVTLAISESSKINDLVIKAENTQFEQQLNDLDVNNIKLEGNVVFAENTKITATDSVDLGEAQVVGDQRLTINANNEVILGDIHKSITPLDKLVVGSKSLLLAGDIRANYFDLNKQGSIKLDKNSSISTESDLILPMVQGDYSLALKTPGYIYFKDSVDVNSLSLDTNRLYLAGDLSLNGVFDIQRVNDIILPSYSPISISNQGGDIRLDKHNLTNNNKQLRLSAPGHTIALGEVSLNALEIFGNTPSNLILSDNIYARKSIDFSDVEKITLAGDIDLETGDHLSEIKLSKLVTGDNNLNLHSRVGNIQLQKVDIKGKLNTDTQAKILLNGNVTADSGVNLAAGNGLILQNDVLVDSQSGNVVLNGDVSGSNKLNLIGNDVYLQKVNVGSLAMEGGDFLSVLGDITTDGDITLNNIKKVHLAGSRKINSGSGTIDVQGSHLVNGTSLELNASIIKLGDLGHEGNRINTVRLQNTDELVLAGDIYVFNTINFDHVGTLSVANDSKIDISRWSSSLDLANTNVKGNGDLSFNLNKGDLTIGLINIDGNLTSKNVYLTTLNNDITSGSGEVKLNSDYVYLNQDVVVSAYKGVDLSSVDSVYGQRNLSLLSSDGVIRLSRIGGNSSITDLNIAAKDVFLNDSVNAKNITFNNTNRIHIENDLQLKHLGNDLNLANTEILGNYQLGLYSKGDLQLGLVDLGAGELTVSSIGNITLADDITANNGVYFKGHGAVTLTDDIVINSKQSHLDLANNTLSGNYDLTLNAKKLTLGKLDISSPLKTLVVNHAQNVILNDDIVVTETVDLTNNGRIQLSQPLAIRALQGDVRLENSNLFGSELNIGAKNITLGKLTVDKLGFQAQSLTLTDNIKTQSAFSTAGIDTVNLVGTSIIDTSFGDADINLQDSLVKGDNLYIKAGQGNVFLGKMFINELAVKNSGMLTTQESIVSKNDVNFSGKGFWKLNGNTSISSESGNIFAADKYLRGNHTLSLAAPNGHIKLASAHIGSLNISAQEVQLEGDLSVKQGGLDFRHVRTLDLAKYASLQTQQSAGNINLSHTSVVGRGNLALYSGLGRTLLGRVSLDGQLIAQNQSRVDVYQPISANKGISLEQTPEVYLHNSGIFTSDAGDIHLPNVVGSGYGFLAKAAGNVHVGSLTTANVNIQSGKGVVLGDVNTNYLNVIAQKDINLNGNTSAQQAASIISSQGQVNMFSNRALNTVGNAVLNGYSGVNISHIKADDVRITSKVGNIHTLPTLYGRNIIARRAELNTRGEIGSNYQPVNLLVSKDLLIYNARKAVLAGLFNKPTLVNTSETTTIMLPKVSKDAAKTALITLEDTRYFDSSIFIDGVTLFTYSDEDLLQVERLESMTTMKE